jgi:hypothetical protein
LARGGDKIKINWYSIEHKDKQEFAALHLQADLKLRSGCQQKIKYCFGAFFSFFPKKIAIKK